MEEMWLPCHEFPDYSVSSYGRVRNDRRDSMVRQSVTKGGVLKVGLVSGGKQYTRSVKVLVAQMFVENDRDPDIFDTPIHLDGDNANNVADNIVWRPRWFAWKYSRQFTKASYFSGVGPIVNTKTGMVYQDIVEAAVRNGLLFEDLRKSLEEKGPVFPSWQIFDWSF